MEARVCLVALSSIAKDLIQPSRTPLHGVGLTGIRSFAQGFTCFNSSAKPIPLVQVPDNEGSTYNDVGCLCLITMSLRWRSGNRMMLRRIRVAQASWRLSALFDECVQ